MDNFMLPISFWVANEIKKGDIHESDIPKHFLSEVIVASLIPTARVSVATFPSTLQVL